MSSTIIASRNFGTELNAAFELPPPEIAPRIEAIFSQIEDRSPGDFIDLAIPICQRLHGQGRSFDAISLVQACVRLAESGSDVLTSWRANNVAGIILGDTGDYAAALEHHHLSMKLAESLGNRICEARSWNNCGLIFLMASSYEIAIECFIRTANTAGAENSSALYSAFVNIAQCELHLGHRSSLRTGIRASHEAFRCQKQEYVEASPYNAVLLHAGYARLLARRHRLSRARKASQFAKQLSSKAKLLRGLLMSAIADASIEIAAGNCELAISKLTEQMPIARKIPGLLVDALSTMACAEMARNQPERAEVYFQEINDFVYLQATEQAHRHLNFATRGDRPSRSRYSAADQWGPMLEWDTFERLAIRAELTTSGDVWRGTRVGTIARLIAIEMGYDEPYATEIGYACRLHDIGMIAIPNIRARIGASLPQSLENLASYHVHHGPEILNTSTHPRAVMASSIARYHHEHWDGTGFPDSLRGDGIPSSARLCAVAEAFEQYTKGDMRDIVVTRALDEIQKQSGAQLDPSMVRALIRSVKEGYIYNYIHSGNWRTASQTNIHNIMKRFSRE